MMFDLFSLIADVFRSSNPDTWVIGRVEFLISLKHLSINTESDVQPFNLSLPRNNRKTTESVLQLCKQKTQEFSSERGSEGSQNGWEQINNPAGSFNSPPLTTVVVCLCQ